MIYGLNAGHCVFFFYLKKLCKYMHILGYCSGRSGLHRKGVGEGVNKWVGDRGLNKGWVPVPIRRIHHCIKLLEKDNRKK